MRLLLLGGVRLLLLPGGLRLLLFGGLRPLRPGGLLLSVLRLLIGLLLGLRLCDELELELLEADRDPLLLPIFKRFPVPYKEFCTR